MFNQDSPKKPEQICSEVVEIYAKQPMGDLTSRAPQADLVYSYIYDLARTFMAQSLEIAELRARLEKCESCRVDPQVIS